MMEPLPIVLRCVERFIPRARYVFDTLLLAAGVQVVYLAEPPSTGPWLLYGPAGDASWATDRCVAVAHCPDAWAILEGDSQIESTHDVHGIAAVLPHHGDGSMPRPGISFDIVANAFCFLTSWPERKAPSKAGTRELFSNSIYARLGIPQDIVDQYLARLMEALNALCGRLDRGQWSPRDWPEGKAYALVLSHDVDFIPVGLVDTLKQGARSALRHLVRQRDPMDGLRAMAKLLWALARGRDPYGCIPEIISREQEHGIRSSFQVAVARRHPNDVNYRIEDDRVRDYLRTITDSGFDLCLHGSYRSTEMLEWYVEEVALLEQRIARPLGSRQHFLSFDYDTLFAAQEVAGIEYDMSMGFADKIGPRAGFSYPYFPYCFEKDRPYDVLEISLFFMDVTLRSYMGLKRASASEVMADALGQLRHKRGCVSLVWHPIVFGGARDPGYDKLFWRIVEHVKGTCGLATDGRAINAFWRSQSRGYWSFDSRSL